MFGIGGTRERVIAVADVGSGSAAVATVVMRHDGSARVLSAARSILPLEDRSREQTMNGVLRMLTEAGTATQKSYHDSADGKKLGPPQEVYAIMRAPWTRANAGHIAKKFDSDTVITKELIAQVTQDSFAVDSGLDRGAMLERAVIRVELNGYPTASPIGKHAQRLDVTTFMSDCDRVMHDGVVSALEALFPGRHVEVRSGARAYLAVSQEYVAHPDAYVIIDMVSEAATVMAVRDGIITHHAVFDEGVRTILRRITGAKGTPEETVSLMRMVVAGSCSGEECDRLNEALARVEPDLVRVFGEHVGELMGKHRLPDTLILFTHPDISDWLGHLFSRIDFAQFTIPLQPFAVKTFTTEALKELMHVTSAVSIDTGVLAATAFVNMERPRLRGARPGVVV